MRLRSIRGLISGLSLFVLLTLGAPRALPSPRMDIGDDEKEMPQLKLFDMDGKPFDGSTLRGSVVIFDFWATWCKPCINEIPELNRLQEKYGSKGLKIVGVTMASGEAKEAKPFVGKFNMHYTVVMGDDGQSYDLNIHSYPTTYLVTKDGKVRRSYVSSGPIKIRDLEAEIQKLLN